MLGISSDAVKALYKEIDRSEYESLEQLLLSRKNALRFPAELEIEFKQYYASRFSQHMRMAMGLVIVMYSMTFLLNLMIFPDVARELLSRFWLVFPVILIFYALSYTDFFKSQQQSLLLGMATVIGMATIGIASCMPPSLQSIYVGSYLLVLIFALAYSRMFFRQALCCSVISILILNAYLWLQGLLSITLWIGHNYIFVCGAGLLLTTNYVMESNIRQRFIQDKMLEAEKRYLQELAENLMKLASVDGLTGIANFRYFDNALKTEWRRATRYQYPISLMMIDLDYFKMLNDNYGHQVGDGCLKQIAETLSGFTRRVGDLVGRYGGDEFIMMLSDVKEAEAKEIALEICRAVRELAIPNEQSPIQPFMTLTIGIATLVPGPEVNEGNLIKKADSALYAAKKQGRHCVVTMSQLSSS